MFRRFLAWEGAVACAMFVCGVLTAVTLPMAPLKRFLLPQPQPQSPSSTPALTRHELNAGRNLPGRPPLPNSSLPQGRHAVLLAFGQSNSANHGDSRYVSGNRVFNHYLGKLYPAMDPLFGATGSGGSVWTRLGDLLVDRLGYDAVIIASIGVGSAKIQRWAPGGDLHPLLIHTLRELRELGRPVTHMIFTQGESDHDTGAEYYQRDLEAMIKAIRAVEPDAPLFISRTSMLRGQISEPVREAQSAAINLDLRVFAGIDTDALGPEFRNAVDHTHFNDRGLDACAQLWLDIFADHPVVDISSQ